MSSRWMQHSKIIPSAKLESVDCCADNIILVQSSPKDACSLRHVYDFGSVDNSKNERNYHASTDAWNNENECSDILRSYSTDKPQNFSLEASPVKKENSSLNILDCSFDDGCAKKFKESKHGELDEIIVPRYEERTVLGISHLASVSANIRNEIFTPNKFDYEYNLFRNAFLFRQIEIISNRLALLEQVVHRREVNVTNTARVSISSTSSNESSLNHPQDEAFTIDYTYGSPVKDDVNCNDTHHHPKTDTVQKQRGTKFSLRHVYRALCTGRRVKDKPSRFEV